MSSGIAVTNIGPYHRVRKLKGARELVIFTKKCSQPKVLAQRAGLQGNSELLIIATATIVTTFKEIYSCRGGCSISRPLRGPNHVGHQCKSSIKTKSQTNAMLPKSDRRAIPSPSGQNNSKMCRIKYTSPFSEVLDPFQPEPEAAPHAERL